jgi:UDP-N-acetylmuramoyl-tripeptide--D-alanyl-D-alanine ligase
MYELGPYEEEGHQVVGRRAKEVADLLITVGDLGRIIAEEAVQAGMPADAAFAVQTNAEAVGLLTRLIETGDGQDRVLVKGSRGASMELIVSALAQAGGPAVLDKQDGPV